MKPIFSVGSEVETKQINKRTGELETIRWELVKYHRVGKHWEALLRCLTYPTRGHSSVSCEALEPFAKEVLA